MARPNTYWVPRGIPPPTHTDMKGTHMNYPQSGPTATVYGTPASGAWDQVRAALDPAGSHSYAAPGYAADGHRSTWSRMPRFMRYSLVSIGLLLFIGCFSPLFGRSALVHNIRSLLVWAIIVGLIYLLSRRKKVELAPVQMVGVVARPSTSRDADSIIEEFRRTGNRNLIPDEVRSWAYGALSEENVGGILNQMAGYEVAHDLTIRNNPNGPVTANVDHLVTGPNGTFMVDTKRWAGTLCARNGSFATVEGGPQDEHRRKAPETLRYEASKVPGGVDLIIVAVDGRGTIQGGSIMLSEGGTPILAVKAEALTNTIRAQRFRPGLPMQKLVTGFPLSL